MDATPRAKASQSKAVVNPSYTAFPKPTEIPQIDPYSPSEISKRQQGELAQAEKTKKVKEDKEVTEFKAMTGPRIIPGGDTGALKVLASLYDSPVIRMFIAASQARKK